MLWFVKRNTCGLLSRFCKTIKDDSKTTITLLLLTCLTADHNTRRQGNKYQVYL